MLDGLDAEILWRQLRRQLRGKPPNSVDGVRVAIGRKDLEAGLQQIDEVSSAAARRIQHAHARADAPAKQLIEQVDVDLPELALEIRQGLPRPSRSASGLRRGPYRRSTSPFLPTRNFVKFHAMVSRPSSPFFADFK